MIYVYTVIGNGACTCIVEQCYYEGQKCSVRNEHMSSQHNVCRLPVAMHGMFTKDTQRAMEPALTTLGHSTTRTE